VCPGLYSLRTPFRWAVHAIVICSFPYFFSPPLCFLFFSPPPVSLLLSSFHFVVPNSSLPADAIPAFLMASPTSWQLLTLRPISFVRFLSALHICFVCFETLHGTLARIGAHLPELPPRLHLIRDLRITIWYFIFPGFVIIPFPLHPEGDSSEPLLVQFSQCAPLEKARFTLLVNFAFSFSPGALFFQVVPPLFLTCPNSYQYPSRGLAFFFFFSLSLFYHLAFFLLPSFLHLE